MTKKHIRHKFHYICPIDVFYKIIDICLNGESNHDVIKDLIRPYYNKYISSL